MIVDLVQTPIEYQPLVEGARTRASGAVVLFLGTVREMSEGRAVGGLDYDAYPAMAKAKLTEVAAEAESRWPLQAATIVHRYGHLEIGDVAVAVVAASAHRAEAFAAAQWMMDTVKHVVPIWKRENWVEGGAEWVHPAGAGRREEGETWPPH